MVCWLSEIVTLTTIRDETRLQFLQDAINESYAMYGKQESQPVSLVVNSGGGEKSEAAVPGAVEPSGGDGMNDYAGASGGTDEVSY